MMPFGTSENYQSEEVFALLELTLKYSEDLVIPGIQLMRADSIFTTQNIMSRVWELIHRSGLLIADLSTKNSNVMYEVGLCHAIGRDVILLANNDEDVPIDLRVASTYLRYDSVGDLAEQIPPAINQYIADNADILARVEDMAQKIHDDQFLRALFLELFEFEGRSLSQQIDDSSLKDKYTRSKYSIALSDFFFVKRGLFEIENFDEYGAGTIRTTETGKAVRSCLEGK
jgi:hypothetical protein